MSIQIEEILSLSVKKRLELIEENGTASPQIRVQYPCRRSNVENWTVASVSSAAIRPPQSPGLRFVIAFKNEKSEGSPHARSGSRCSTSY
jgi:hypothetical protein